MKGQVLQVNVIADASSAHGSDRALGQIRPSIQQRGDEHVAGDATDGIEMNVLQGRLVGHQGHDWHPPMHLSLMEHSSLEPVKQPAIKRQPTDLSLRLVSADDRAMSTIERWGYSR